MALKNFTFKLDSKSVFGLLGPNGAGKSTFLKIVCGSLKDFEGEVYIEGRAAQQIKDVQINYCPQFDILLDELSVFDHLKFFAFFKGAKFSELDSMCMDAICRVNLKDKKDKPARELSGGMRRRCSLAIALAGPS